MKSYSHYIAITKEIHDALDHFTRKEIKMLNLQVTAFILKKIQEKVGSAITDEEVEEVFEEVLNEGGNKNE